MMRHLLAALLLAVPGFAMAPWPGEIVLVLNSAIPGERAVTIHLEHRDGKWSEAWGEAFQHNKSLHGVKVHEATVAGDQMKLKLTVSYRPDFWVKDATGEYAVEIKRGPAAVPTVSDHTRLRSSVAKAWLTGTFTGSFTGPKQPTQAVSGDVEGALLPWRELTEERGERPRLLFRKRDLPGIRERLKTPLGQAVLAELQALDHELAPAILYQLTGNAEHAQKAYVRIAAGFKSELAPDTKGYGGNRALEHIADYPASHHAAAAYVYDLCYEAWTPGQRAACEQWLRWMTEWAVQKPWSYSNVGATAGALGGSAGLVYSAGGILTLALWGLPAPPPPEPSSEVSPLLSALGAAPAPEEIEKARTAWRTRMELYKESGGQDLELYEMALWARRGMAARVNERIGEGGTIWGTIWQRPTLDCAIAYRNTFGCDISARHELRNAAVLPLVKTIGWQPGKGTAADVALGPEGPLPLETGVIPRLLVLADPAWRPAVEEHWLRMVKMTRADLQTVDGAREFLRRSFPTGDAGTEEPWSLLYALQYFGTSAGQSSAAVPRSWEVTTRGQLLFNSGDVNEPFLITLDGNTSDTLGPTLSGGNFEVYAFGRRWTGSVPPTQGGDSRARHNVVHIPGQIFSRLGRGRIVQRWLDGAGGGLCLDLDSFCREEHTVRTERLETRKIGAMTTAVPVTKDTLEHRDVGCRSYRAMAVDYSGKCGAPALLVIVDRFEAAKEKLWLLNTPDLMASDRPAARGAAEAPPLSAKTDGATFELRSGEASLRGVFVSPADARPVFASGSPVEQHIHFSRAAGRGPLPLRRAGIELRVGADRSPALLFTVITLQRGPAPEVKVAGSGLDAVATIGARTVRFDGTKIVFGDHTP